MVKESFSNRTAGNVSPQGTEKALEKSLVLRLIENEEDLFAAQRLRYRVFVEELGGGGPDVDHLQKLERDRFDAFFDHLVLIDPDRPAPDHVVGVYRMMDEVRAAQAGGFYSESEYDLTPLLQSGRKLLELGRSCVDPAFRDGSAMFQLWTGLSDYIQANGIKILFGVASFHGTDPRALRDPLSFLHHRHLAPEPLRVVARPPHAASMDLRAPDQVDRKAALLQMPALIKAYLRLGGCVGQGAWVDHAFNTTDICLIMETTQMNARQRRIYGGGGR